ncbi:unnamed protein product [Ceratitis capitata]|uniref:(Mediterranean fruit fly) hypothetical protein n=1 Tax=Ceratitis capitata TaxID=7213 RepID=A0A811VF49_CERCA|nr:unnamed protein product [Ceratitis capitata]
MQPSNVCSEHDKELRKHYGNNKKYFLHRNSKVDALHWPKSLIDFRAHKYHLTMPNECNL